MVTVLVFSVTLQQQMHNKIDIASNFIKKKRSYFVVCIRFYNNNQISALLKFSLKKQQQQLLLLNFTSKNELNVIVNIFLIILESLRFRLIAKIVKGKHLEIPGFHIISVYHTCSVYMFSCKLL